MNKPSIIPIFPLPLTLFPTEMMPLHIFEPRYRKLIQDAIAADKKNEPFEFGIIYSNQGKVSPVGCSAVVHEIFQEHEDGRYELLVLGKSRFTVKELLTTVDIDHYSSAKVDWFSDASPEWSENLANQAFAMHRETIRTLLGAYPNPDFYRSRTHLSFFIGQSIGLDPQGKQRLLESLSENERLQEMIEFMTHYLGDWKRVESIRSSIQNTWSFLMFSKNNKD